jgi:hypothetical protein
VQQFTFSRCAIRVGFNKSKHEFWRPIMTVKTLATVAVGIAARSKEQIRFGINVVLALVVIILITINLAKIEFAVTSGKVLATAAGFDLSGGGL